MKVARPNNLSVFVKNHSIILWIGLLTALTIILFQVVSLFVIYRYLRLNYYLCLVAIFFFATGILLNKRSKKSILPVPPQGSLLDLLSTKEIIVLQMVAEGKTNKEIAAALFIELSTVKTHVNHIYSKISVTNRKEARIKFSILAEKRTII